LNRCLVKEEWVVDCLEFANCAWKKIKIRYYPQRCTSRIQHCTTNLTYSKYLDSDGKRCQKGSKLYNLWCSSVAKYRLKNM
jgi:hypothetical protein